MSAHDAERRTIRDAIERLLAGEPVRSDGKLTIKSLADEAGVKRWLLTHRHTDLQTEFRDRIDGLGTTPEPVRKLEERINALETDNRRLGDQLREAKATVSMLERLVAVETLESLETPPKTQAPTGTLRAIPTSGYEPSPTESH